MFSASSTLWKKITEKVSFNIASEASYVYILSGQKFIKNAKNGQFDEFWKPEAFDLTVLPDRLSLIGYKLVKIAKIEKFKCGILDDFQTMWNGILKVRFFCWTPSSEISVFTPSSLMVRKISFQSCLQRDESFFTESFAACVCVLLSNLEREKVC